MRRIFSASILLVFLLITLGCTTKVPPVGQDKPDQQKPPVNQQEDINTVSAYFPLVEDRIYTYKGEGNEYASKVVTVEYIKGRVIQRNTNNGGTALAEVFVVGQGSIKKVFAKEESYWHEDFTEQRGQEEIILQQPIKVGTEWESNGKKYRISSVDAKITVPYGTYNAVKVVTELQDSTFSRYFVKNIGIVKEEFISGSTVVTSELTEMLQEPVRVKAEIAYPDEQAMKLIELNRDIYIETNQSLADRITEELKAAPYKNTQSSLPSSVRLLSYKREDNSIRLNFSKELISAMNAGTSLEGLRLDAIVNSYSKAFGVEGAIINVEGKSYESGHYSFGIDEIIKAK